MLHPTEIMPSLHTLDLTIPTQLGVSGDKHPTPPRSYLYELLGWTTCPPTINYFIILWFYHPSPDTFTLPNFTSIPNPSQRYNYAFDHKPAWKPFYRTLSTRYWCFLIARKWVHRWLIDFIWFLRSWTRSLPQKRANRSIDYCMFGRCLIVGFETDGRSYLRRTCRGSCARQTHSEWVLVFGNASIGREVADLYIDRLIAHIFREDGWYTGQTTANGPPSSWDTKNRPSGDRGTNHEAK